MTKKLVRGLLLLCSCVSLFSALTQAQTTYSANNLVVNVIDMRFTLSPAGTQTFNLPNVATPIRIEISSPSSNGSTQNPSELMTALVNWDNGSSGSHQITWIGTNSDGSTVGSNSGKSATIASIFAGSSTSAVSLLKVFTASAGQVQITRNAAVTSAAGNYVVRIYY